MKSAVVVFPGINRERDMLLALESVTGSKPISVWHTETELPKVDLVVVPGGFSYGDYLRCGAIAARSPIMQDIRAKALRDSRFWASATASRSSPRRASCRACWCATRTSASSAAR
jgi:phosphoribosylformylglycinamidine (FGAM) synthase-like amidotransferase family enzyme